MEYKEVFSYKAGKDFVAYLNADKSLKIYYNNSSDMVEAAEPKNYEVSENLCVWKMDKRLMVWDKGKIKEHITSYFDCYWNCWHNSISQ